MVITVKAQVVSGLSCLQYSVKAVITTTATICAHKRNEVHGVDDLMILQLEIADFCGAVLKFLVACCSKLLHSI